MKFFAISLLAGLAAASPIAVPESSVSELESLESRQLINISNDLERGSSSNCPKAILIFARGSTELGNLVSEHISCILCDLVASLASIPRVYS